MKGIDEGSGVSPAVSDTASLSAINHHLRLALDQVDEAVVIVEPGPTEGEGPRIVYGNRAAYALSGMRPEEVLGRPLSLLFDEERLDFLLKRLTRVAEAGRRFKVEAILRCADGYVKVGRWTVRAVTVEGETVNYTLTFRESDAPPVEEEAGAACEATEGAPEVEGRGGAADGGGAIEEKCKTETLAFIASGIAHDFNNVLTPVIGNLSLVEHDVAAGTEMARQVASAKSAAEEAKALARQILDFAKGDGVKKEAGDVGRLVKEAARLATTGANVRCDVALEAELPPVDMNATQVLNVFNNLLINARQAMPDGGVVQASAGTKELGAGEIENVAAGRYVEVKVRDRGCGIPEADLGNIFRAFFTTKGKEGTGLGLATCRSIVREHGGEITVRSTVGTGSEFRVFLPVCAVEEPNDGGAEEEQAVMRGEGCVLVVDDQDSIRTVAAAIIRKLGYEALSARSGEEAVSVYGDRMREGRPVSAVLLDMTLPGGMSGMDTLEELLGLDADVRTIASSGYFDEDALAGYRERGYVGVLPKPYTVERLSRAVHDAIHFDPVD